MLAIYIVWCTINLFLAVYSLISDGWDEFGEDFYPFGSSYLRDYDLTELTVYCGLPVLVYWVYHKIVEKFYDK